MERRSKRVLKYGFHSFLTAIAVTGIFVVGYGLLGRYHKRWDLTENKRFSLSDQTRQVLKNLEKKVEIYAFWKSGTPEYFQVEELLREYSYLSPYIKFEMIDPDKNPSFTRQMGISEYGTTVFQSGERRKDVYERDVFTYAYFGGRREFKGEEAFTSAIIEVTSLERKKIYFLTGHGEKDIFESGNEGYSTVRNYLEKEGFEVETWNILEKGKLPQDADLLVIAGPRSDFFEKEKELLSSFYSEKKGNLLIMVDPDTKPQVKSFLESIGVKVKEGMIIDPVASMIMDAGSPLPEYSSHPITQKLMKMKSSVILSGATALEVEDDKWDKLLTSRSSSWLEKDYRKSRVRFDEGRDEKGPLVLGVAREEEGKRVVVYADSDFPSNVLTAIQGNLDLFLNTVDWLVGEEKKISIRPRTLERRPFKLTPKEARFIYITSLFLVPFLILVTGGIVWLRRRSG